MRSLLGSLVSQLIMLSFSMLHAHNRICNFLTLLNDPSCCRLEHMLLTLQLL